MGLVILMVVVTLVIRPTTLQSIAYQFVDPSQQQQPQHALWHLQQTSQSQQQPTIAMFPPSSSQSSQHQYYQHPIIYQQPQSSIPVRYPPQQFHQPNKAPHSLTSRQHKKSQQIRRNPIPIPVMSSTQFASRRGPLDKVIKGAKQYLPSIGNKRRRDGGPVRFMEMNRLPKPPKYPLYDMPDMGMATPPPPPLMHPMGASASNMLQTISNSPLPHSKRGGRAPPRGGKKPHGNNRAGPPHQSGGRHGPLHHGPRQPPNHHHHHHHNGPPGRSEGRRHPSHGKHKRPHGYEQTMESNLDHAVNSPPLGRPLSYDEYMQRPSHSFTDDPWNFDPYAANYNSGMNTFAMKYNYDPLGMNSLDKTQTHLDPQQLSYPGDIYNMDDPGVAIGKVTQVGGWDTAPNDFRTSGLTPPPLKDSSSVNIGIDLHGVRRNDPLQNSFNQYPFDSSSSSTTNVDSTKSSDSGLDFTIDTTEGDNYKTSDAPSSSSYDTSSQSWNSYPQNGQNVYDGFGSDSESQYSHTINNYEKTPESQAHLQQLKESAKYENGKYDAATQLHTFGLSQDYIHQERPISDLTDNYNPYGSGGQLNTDLTPPGETAAMFKRQGSRPARQEKTPLIELEGLSLFKDILKNEKAAAARSQLIRVLTN